MAFEKKDLKQWIKERDEACKSFDIEKFKEFYNKWRLKGFYNMPLPSDNIVETTMRKVVCNINNATAEEKAEAEKWLREHNGTPTV